MTLAEAAARADELAKGGNERELADLRREWADELDFAARSADYRERAAAYRAIGQFRFRQKLELLSRDAPREINAVRPLLHTLANADDNPAVRRLAVIALRNGSPQRDTVVLLQGIAEEESLERDLRETAAKVAAGLEKKARAR